MFRLFPYKGKQFFTYISLQLLLKLLTIGVYKQKDKINES